jgi:TPR repeat protein/serine/threonine protein kinase
MSAPDIARCPHCFGATRVTPCPHCGWQPAQDNPPPALSLGRVLDGRYRIGRVLGHGGFGITYLAWDNNLHLRLAIKEYLPRDSATRAPDGVSLAIYSGQAGDQFAYGLDRFLEEARALAHFDQHPGIVTVKNFFRAHGTGYCVMDYVQGITLRQYLEQQTGGRITVDDALKLLMPVMDALRAVHKEGLLHRDLAPDNIYLTEDGRIKLLDFGAARFAASEHSKSLSIILKPGYAPEEQYRTRGKQGPWTDVYGLAATFYRAITGQVPPESLDRLDNDDLVPPSRLGIAITPGQEATLLQALVVKAEQRFQSMADLQLAWRSGADLALKPNVDKEGSAKTLAVVAQPATPIGPILAIAGGLAILAAVGYKLGAPPSPSVTGTHTPIPATTTTSPQPIPTAPISIAQAPNPQVSVNSAETMAEGVLALQQGDYQRAWAILTPLAESGDAEAQVYIGRLYAEGGGIAKDETKAVRWYRKAAEQGDARGQFLLGVAYANGEGIAKDEAEAVRWYRKAAEQGDDGGQVNLGVAYANGEGVAKNEAEAVRWYRKAAEQGVARGQVNLGNAYAHGRGVTRDQTEAIRWYRKAAEQGDARGQFFLGVAYANGQGVAKNEAEAVRWYRKAAEQGDANGQFVLGGAYAFGQGVVTDEAEAVRWYRKAAEQGLAEGQFYLGMAYVNGQGVTKDEAEGVRWYRKAAEQGLAEGQFYLGVVYVNGQGVAKNEAEAVRWYRKAAEQGYADGQLVLGMMYMNGQGVAKDEAEAVRWYRKTAEQSSARGQFLLGVMYAEGRGVVKDEAEALRWFRKAAEQGDAGGQFLLGASYEFGHGNAKDQAEAIRWYRKAAAQGHAGGQASLDRLTREGANPSTRPTVPANTPAPPPAPTAPEGKAPLYFAAALAPTANIPPEAPLCYKFMVAGPEEQLRKLKSKYPGLYDDQISTNPLGGKNLVAKRKDETGKEIIYFYSTSPGVCDDYQKGRLQTPTPQGDRAGSNAPPQTGAASTSAGGASPNERYRFVGKDQDIVEDTRTKLQWQRCSQGQTWNGATCAGEATKYTWYETQRIAPAGWRLPTKDELASLVYCSSGEPAYWKTSSETCHGAYSKPTIWSAVFANTPESWFWSSSPYASFVHGAWSVYFGSGYIYDGGYKDYTRHVRLVRGGQ